MKRLSIFAGFTVIITCITICMNSCSHESDGGRGGTPQCVASDAPFASTFEVVYAVHSYINQWTGEIVHPPVDSIWSGQATVAWDPQMQTSGEVECGIDIEINEPGDSVRYYEGTGTAVIHSVMNDAFFAEFHLNAAYIRPVYSVPVPIPFVNCTMLGLCSVNITSHNLPQEPQCGSAVEEHGLFGEWNSSDSCFVFAWDELSSSGDLCSKYSMSLCPH
jgi:hypothetical protein